MKEVIVIGSVIQALVWAINAGMAIESNKDEVATVAVLFALLNILMIWAATK